MRVDSELVALRGDRASQRDAQRALDRVKAAWLALPEVDAIARDFSRYADGAGLADLPSLGALVGTIEIAKPFIAEWQRRLVAALDAHKFGHVPFKHNYSAGFSTVRLLQQGMASLSVLVYDQVEEETVPQSATFSEREQHEIVIAGRAKALHHRLSAGAVETVSQTLESGSTMAVCDAQNTRTICNVKGRLLMLQLGRECSRPRPVRDIRLSDGALLYQASGEKRESQITMAMAVLTEMRRSDAVPQYVELAQQGHDHMRWDALRHILALDPVRGFTMLNTIAANATDDLAQPARALRDQLAAAHPQLLHLEKQTCPA